MLEYLRCQPLDRLTAVQKAISKKRRWSEAPVGTSCETGGLLRARDAVSARDRVGRRGDLAAAKSPSPSIQALAVTASRPVPVQREMEKRRFPLV
jgi:hypothetical protein